MKKIVFFILFILLFSQASAQNHVDSENEFQNKEMNAEIEVLPSSVIKLNSEIEKIVIRFSFEDSSEVDVSEINSADVSILNEFYKLNDFEIDETENALVLNLNKSFPPEEFVKYLGNETYSNSVRVNYAKENSGGQLTRETEKEIEFATDAENLKISLKEWYNACFATESSIDLSVLTEKIPDEMEVVLQDIRNNSYLECKFLEEKSSEGLYKFSCSIQIPKENETENTEVEYAVIVYALIEGKEEIEIKKFILNLVNDIEINPIYPEYGKSYYEEGNKSAGFKASIRCMGNQELLGIDSIPVEINGKTVTLIKNEKEGYFEANNVFENIEPGEELQISLSLKGDFAGNYLDYETSFENFNQGIFPNNQGFDQGFNQGLSGTTVKIEILGYNLGEYPLEILEIAGIIAAVIITGIVILFFLKKRKGKKENREELTEKKKEIEGLIKQIEIEFYKRRITESEYKKGRLEYQEKLRLIEVKLGLKKKEPKP